MCESLANLAKKCSLGKEVFLKYIQKLDAVF